MFIRFLALGGRAAHYRLLSLAFPMILANITTPLVGLVDTAVLGHMDTVSALAGASVSGYLFTQVIWLCGFLRMSITGLSAQAFGDKSTITASKVLWQSLFVAGVLGLSLWIIRTHLFSLAMQLSSLESTALMAADEYFSVRALSFPIALFNLVLVGWLVGQHKTKQVLMVQVIANSVNLVLNLLFVYIFDWGVSGVALATVLAEILMCTCYFSSCFKQLKDEHLHPSWFRLSALRTLLNTNLNMLLRNILLQGCIAFIVLQGAKYGVVTAAINAILMQIFALIALGLDGIANAVEAQVGKAKGQGSRIRLIQYIAQGTMWSSVIAIIYAVFFAFSASWLTSLFSSQQSVIEAMPEYYWVIVLLPLLGHWCFLFDGVAIGLSAARAMRNTMLLSALVGFLPTYYLWQAQQNMALWLAMLVFLLLRGVSLGALITYRYILSNSS